MQKKRRKKIKGKVVKKNEKIQKKKQREKCNVDYCCNPRWFWCGGIVIPPHHLVLCIIVDLTIVITSWNK